jgi:hypothetical protein
MDTPKRMTPDQARAYLENEVTPQLVEALDALFPQPVISPADDQRVLLYQAGHNRVVQFLRSLL